jgi:hypothetical protein
MARRSGWPVPTFVFFATLGSALALLVRDALPLFPYAVLALSVGGLLLAFPLLSDLGALLRHDEGGEWIGSLPALPVERAIARTLHLAVFLAGLAFAWSAPWAILAPDAVDTSERLALPALALLQAVFLAALWVSVQQLLLARLEGVFVLLESALVVVVVVTLVRLLGNLPWLATLVPGRAGLGWFPPVWFAIPLVDGGWTWGAPLGVTALSIVALLAVRTDRPQPFRRRRSERWLEPLRRVAVRTWVRAEERGAFDLVYLVLPREREVALRTYPMLGIPLAFLWISATRAHGEGEVWRADLLALLLFTAGIYLPLLLTHVPLTESPGAAFLLRTAPCPASAVAGGAIKALFVRYLLPLYCTLLGLGLALGQAELLVRLWLPAVLLGLVLLRLLYPACVRDLPLSVAPEELRSEVDWAGRVATLAIGLTLLAVVANRFLDWKAGLGLAFLLGLCELALERKLGRTEAKAGG